ncbi:hypothetical protein BN1049_02756 [Pseudomonas saudimassiliensis]|uniref:DUF559 domain-containing protein n=1 Tax=Pseudomonas saudimassiliensis TaxID=1461581 RepID=A0A078MNI2_9PSED|nr:DUF559 domain-containing protein [Pseudomonas saudimassiliensis]CEA06371.1 hypothetical protein BN1049_02756 [Pseudomonas saudimassiliensis]CEF27796.1 hypothetical protein BN1049_02756 [Pseudomonas saudimassiliensis]
MDIRHWIALNKERFDSPYEQMFAERVLVGVDGLDLSTVATQYQFRDLDNKTRYCDFVIQEGSIRIAIEVDGYDKKNRGSGMTHEEFVDWQRRQAALTSAGWHVLRFANRDVCNHPGRCKRYIELLLRDQRSKSQHQSSLESAIAQMSRELEAAQRKAGTADQVGRLTRQINLLKNQLLIAQSAQPLTERDRREMEQLVTRLEEENRELKHEKNKLEKQSQILGGENSTMKTTVWAFTLIIGFLIAAGAYVLGGRNNSVPVTANVSVAPPQTAVLAAQSAPVAARPQQIAASSASTVSAVQAGQSCAAPIDWRNARDFADQEVAVVGPVAEYRYMPNVNGSPTWINLGTKYPQKNRLAVVVWGDDRSNFGDALTSNLVNRQVCVIGTVQMRDGVPQIAISQPQSLLTK